MLIEDIFSAIKETEEWEWESEAPFHHYAVKYNIDTNTVEVFFVEEYHFDGDNWGEIETKTVETKIFFAEFITPSMYINLLVSLMNNRRELEHLYGDAPNKVLFVRV